MKAKLLVLFISCILFVSGCAGTPKVSVWNSPPERHMTVGNVFDSAIIAGTENKFTVMNSDRNAGVISMKQEVYGGDHKNNERRMSVRIKQASKNSVEIKTKVSGSDFGVVEGLLGGLIHQEITNNFYVYLFRELNITDPSEKQVMVANENSTDIDVKSTPTYVKKEATHKTKTAETQKISQTELVKVHSEEVDKDTLKLPVQSTGASIDSMVVSVKKANLRKKPNPKSETLATLVKGTVVKVIQQRDDWYMVELDGGDVGWCSKSCLLPRK